MEDSDAALGGACFALAPRGIRLGSDDVPDTLVAFSGSTLFMNAIYLFARNRGCGYGWVEGDDWVEDEDAA